MHHIHYIDSPESPHRLVIEVDQGKLNHPYGTIDAVYGRRIQNPAFTSNRLEDIGVLVQDDLLVISDVVKAGDVITIELRSNHVFEDIMLDEVHNLVELVNESGMLYWILVGRTGAFSIRATVAEDREGKIAKLRTNLKDMPLRKYLADQARVENVRKPVAEPDYPPYMDSELAARYLGISIKTFYAIPRFELPQSRHGRYRKVDLDTYMEAKLKRK